MRGTVKIGETDVDMLANAASAFIYKRIFHKDFLTSIEQKYTDENGKVKTEYDKSAITEMACAMHKQRGKEFKELVDTGTLHASGN